MLLVQERNRRKLAVEMCSAKNFFPFPKFICVKLDFQGMGQQNLNIVTH